MLVVGGRGIIVWVKQLCEQGWWVIVFRLVWLRVGACWFGKRRGCSSRVRCAGLHGLCIAFACLLVCIMNVCVHITLSSDFSCS